MLDIFNNIRPFFEDVYREISVRAYAKEQHISPPTASKLLKDYAQEGLLIEEEKGVYLYFKADRNSVLFQGLAKLYWYKMLYDITEHLHQEIAFRHITLFGSLAKAENTKTSDVDLYVDVDERPLDIQVLEKKLKRTVQLHFINETNNRYLKENIKNGVVIR